MQGTRKELLEELALWFTGLFPKDDPKQIYFLSGAAGLGKSSIAHQLCTLLDSLEQRSLGASFFFVRGGGDLESTRLFFSTLAYQLSTSQPQLRSRIISAARTHHERGDRQQMRHAFEDLVRTPLLGAPIGEQGPIVLVVDGLDECQEREMVPPLLGFLIELARKLPWLQVFVTSRPEPHVLTTFASPEATAMVHHRSLDDTVDAWGNDVKRYLEETISKIPSYTQFVRDHPDDFERLVERAGGIFIYARIAVNFLDIYRDDPGESFSLILSSLGVGVEPLDALYLRVLQSAFPQNYLRASSRRHSILRSFLTSIALLQEHQPPEAIALIWDGLTRGDVVTMIDRLRSVLLVGTNGAVRPVHATLAEFLLDDTRCTDPLYHVDQRKGHAQLASSCFDAFSFKTITDCLAVEPAQQATSAVWQYVSYAVVQWDSHLENAEFSEELLKKLHALSSSQMGLYRRSFYSVGIVLIDYDFADRHIKQWLKASNSSWSSHLHAQAAYLCLFTRGTGFCSRAGDREYML